MARKIFFGLFIFLGVFFLILSLAGCDLLNNNDEDTGGNKGGDTPGGTVIDNNWLNSHGWTVGHATDPSSYTVNSMLTVTNTNTLTILPGTTITFTNTGYGITVNDGGKIMANGTSSRPITLKRDGGYWAGIDLRSAPPGSDDNILNYVTLKNAGTASGQAIRLFSSSSGSSAKITNCTIDGSGRYGIYADASSNTVITEFENNIIKNCADAPIYVTSYLTILRNLGTDHPISQWTGNGTGNSRNYIQFYGTIGNAVPQDMTLKNIGIPYYMSTGCAYNTYTLTIQEGTQILMGSGRNFTVEVNAKLVALGTPTQHIVFKGLNDVAGYWHGIRIVSSSQGSKLAFVDISGGGGGTSPNFFACLNIATNSFDAYTELYYIRISKSSNHGLAFSNRDLKLWQQYVSFDSASIAGYDVCDTRYGQNESSLPTATAGTNWFTPGSGTLDQLKYGCDATTTAANLVGAWNISPTLNINALPIKMVFTSTAFEFYMVDFYYAKGTCSISNGTFTGTPTHFGPAVPFIFTAMFSGDVSVFGDPPGQWYTKDDFNLAFPGFTLSDSDFEPSTDIFLITNSGNLLVTGGSYYLRQP